MPADVWIGAGGAVLIAAAAVARQRARRADRKWAVATASVLVFAGWILVAEFIVKPLVPGMVTAAVLLGGLTLGILLTAVVGGRAHSSGKLPDGTKPSANARNVGASGSSDSSSTSNHVTDDSAESR